MPYEINPILDRLCAAFPAGFSRTAPKPLKIGLGEEVMALAGVHPALADLTRTQIRRALKVYTGMPVYRKALINGGPRYDLDGQPVGEVTPDQQAFAQRPRSPKAPADADAAADATASPRPRHPPAAPRRDENAEPALLKEVIAMAIPGKLDVTLKINQLPQAKPATTQTVVFAVQAEGQTIVVELKNKMWNNLLYTGPYGGRGAPRRYAGKVDWTHRDPAVFTAVASPDPDLLLETAVVYVPRLCRRVRVVVVMHRRTQRIALRFSTALDLDPVTLYRYDAARFQIEFLFRDSKQFAGLTHCQARRTDALTVQVNASLTAVSLSKLQAVRTLGHLPTPFSMASLVRRCFNEHFLKKILAYLAHGQTLTENGPEYETFCNYGIIQPATA